MMTTIQICKADLVDTILEADFPMVWPYSDSAAHIAVTVGLKS
jgi:hypothetical protein